MSSFSYVLLGDFDGRVVGGVANPVHRQHGGAGNAHQLGELIEALIIGYAAGRAPRVCRYLPGTRTANCRWLAGAAARRRHGSHFNRHDGVIGFAQAFEAHHFVGGRQAQADQLFVGRWGDVAFQPLGSGDSNRNRFSYVLLPKTPKPRTLIIN